MAEHTKGRPWKFIKALNDYLIVPKVGEGVIAKVYSRFAGTAEADSRFIVTACNNHDKLVEALKSVNIMLNCQLQRYSEEPWAQRVKEALKEVETQHGCSPVSMPKHYGKHRDGRIIGESTLTTE